MAFLLNINRHVSKRSRDHFISFHLLAGLCIWMECITTGHISTEINVVRLRDIFLLFNQPPYDALCVQECKETSILQKIVMIHDEENAHPNPSAVLEYSHYFLSSLVQHSLSTIIVTVKSLQFNRNRMVLKR